MTAVAVVSIKRNSYVDDDACRGNLSVVFLSAIYYWESVRGTGNGLRWPSVPVGLTSNRYQVLPIVPTNSGRHPRYVNI